MKIPIIFESGDFFIVDKPAGVLSGDLISQFDLPGLTHRLDKDTSGVMALGKTEKVIKELQKLFKERRVKKSYLALVHGQVKEAGTIRASIGRSKGLKRGADFFGRQAVTHFKAKKYYKYNNFTLLECVPETGRTHQIRVHLKSIGHPIAGDRIYKFKRQVPPQGLRRQFLHASSLELLDYKFKAPLPGDLQTVLLGLK